jgi:hypothetical protein
MAVSEPVPPAQTPEQRHAALRKAQMIRKQRAADKALIAERSMDARRILADPPEHWQRAKIADLLHALPGVGITKVTNILKETKVSPSRTITGLTEDQRERIATSIRRYCPKNSAGGIAGL